ncbi:ABC transporter ATP-binding protein [Nocardia suismassiliense]|uniref:ABC transporter ATP-binding protein n=1 Tax=Nocardia suismassiliense TaxID=2077092 RepID=A0ABW6QTK6_9NOCA
MSSNDIARGQTEPELSGAADRRVNGEDPAGSGVMESAAIAGALEVHGLACAAGRRTVVSDVSFAIRAGETIGIVGPNGAGKSTLLQTLAGVRRPVRGRVTVDGEVLHEMSSRRRARTVAMVAQDERPPADLRAGEVVALGLTPYLPPWGAGSPLEQQAVQDALATVDLTGFADRPVHRLSGGERQRVLLARALVQNTPVLLLDEPTNHLDITHRLELLALTRTLQRTVIMALHDLTLADRYCDRILVLHNGTAHPLAAPATALAPDVVDTVFGVRALRVPHPETGDPHLLITPREATL